MDLSSGIFVALAVGWACYLIPKALRHHDEVAKSRSVETFSAATRVVARREPVGRSEAVIVSAPDPKVARLAAARAARKRRRILGLLGLAMIVCASLAAFQVMAWHWVAVPVGLAAGFLVLCRVLVKRERRTAWVASERVTAASEEAAPEIVDLGAESDEDTTLLDLSDLKQPEPVASFWDPLPMAVPTYVGKEMANRSVRTIDLAAPGVVSSGHNAADSRLVAESDARRADRDEDEGPQRLAAGA